MCGKLFTVLKEMSWYLNLWKYVSICLFPSIPVFQVQLNHLISSSFCSSIFYNFPELIVDPIFNFCADSLFHSITLSEVHISKLIVTIFVPTSCKVSLNSRDQYYTMLLNYEIYLLWIWSNHTDTVICSIYLHLNKWALYFFEAIVFRSLITSIVASLSLWQVP